MKTKHIFTKSEVIELLRKTHNIPGGEEIEIEEYKSNIYTFPNAGPSIPCINPYMSPYTFTC